MRRLVAGLTAILLLVILTGCENNSGSETTAKPRPVTIDVPNGRIIKTPGGSRICYYVEGETFKDVCPQGSVTPRPFDPNTEYSGNDADDETDAIIASLWFYQGSDDVLKKLKQKVRKHNQRHAAKIEGDPRWVRFHSKVPTGGYPYYPSPSSPAPTSNRSTPAKVPPTSTSAPPASNGVKPGRTSAPSPRVNNPPVRPGKK